jgi:hypothetical protein
MMYAIHFLHLRVCFVRDNSTLEPDTKKGIYLRLRHDEPGIIRIFLTGLVDDNHPYAVESKVKIPSSTYQLPFSELSMHDQSQLLWRAREVANAYCYEQRIFKRSDGKIKLSFMHAYTVPLIFGK